MIADQVMRAIPLEKRVGTLSAGHLHYRPWFEPRSGHHRIVTDVEVGHKMIPIKPTADGRLMRARYRPPLCRNPRRHGARRNLSGTS